MDVLSSADVVREALEIADEYERDGLKLTLRQMYYQFVARGMVASGQISYRKIGSALTNARYSGDFPIESLEDRGRTVDHGDYTTNNDDVGAALEMAATELRRATNWLWRSRWLNQPIHLSVWVEKEALSGIFEPTCEKHGVSWFACKGYPSVSALHSWLCGAREAFDAGAQEAVVLYFGDHDPDGWEIPRSAERNIEKLRALDGSQDDFPITFKRLALNMDQIRTYNPPPFEAKMSSTRFAGYVEEHATNDAWELDALEPRVLRSLIDEGVREHYDQSIFRDNRREILDLRSEMRDRMDADWVQEVLDSGSE